MSHDYLIIEFIENLKSIVDLNSIESLDFMINFLSKTMVYLNSYYQELIARREKLKGGIDK